MDSSDRRASRTRCAPLFLTSSRGTRGRCFESDRTLVNAYLGSMTPKNGPRRRVFVHLAVPFLTVPAAWRVGGTTFLPPGRLLARLDRDQAKRRRVLGDLDEYLRRQLAEDGLTTAMVPAWTRNLSTGRIESETYAAARDTARDSIAVIRLFQRSSTSMSIEHEAFGLAVDVGSAREDRWVTDRDSRVISFGTAMHGSIGRWEVCRADIAAFWADQRFAYLEGALRKAGQRRTDWESRVVNAVRTFAMTTTLHRPGQRIVSAATAIEALVGDAYRPGTGGTGGHNLARRAAFAWCGVEFGDPHGPAPARASCPYLTATASGDLKKRMREVEERSGARPPCDYYATLRVLADDRNAAVHAADVPLSDQQARRHEYTVEKVLMAVIGRIVSGDMTTLSDYEAAIKSLRRLEG